MGILKLKLLGVNAYVPHTDGQALLAVLPNASSLGTSPAGALDGTSLKQHVPFLWEKTEKSGRFSVVLPRVFLGARLSFVLGGTTTEPNFKAVSDLDSKCWLDVDPDLLKAAADDRMAGQVVITRGVATLPPANSCNKAWSLGSFTKSLEPVINELTVEIQGVDSIKAVATPWVNIDPRDLYDRQNIGANETVELRVGNFCAEDVLDWPRNSVAGRVRDRDFKWIYGLSRRATLPAWLSYGLPVPVVEGSSIHDHITTSSAFEDFWGGGGGAGCECNGCVDKPGTFSY